MFRLPPPLLIYTMSAPKSKRSLPKTEAKIEIESQAENQL